MTPQRAADLLANESPSERGTCDRCYADAPLYVEPENLWTKEHGARVCEDCTRRIAARRKPAQAQPLGMGL